MTERAATDVAEDAQAYIDAIAPAHRPLFDRILRLTGELHPDVTVVLSYQMPTFVVGDYRLCVGAWRHGLSLYGWERARGSRFAALYPELLGSKGTLKVTHRDAERISDEDFRDLLRVALGG